MSSYTTVKGDTFESIARKFYGNELQATAIDAANPGAQEPLNAGTPLIIPADVTAPRAPRTAVAGADENGVTIQIDGEEFLNWSRLKIDTGFDKISTFSFDAPFEPADAQFRRVFKPFSYKTVQIYIGDSVAFTGTIVSTIPTSEPGSNTLSVSGYSRPGVLADCMPPAPGSASPYEFLNLNVVEIAYNLGVPFGVQAIGGFGAPGAPFEQVSIQPTEKVLPFLAGLARQRGMVIGSDADGEMVFRKEKSAPGADLTDVFLPANSAELGRLSATFSPNEGPVNSVVPRFETQNYYSHITSFEPVVVTLQGQKYTATNTRLKGVLRPHNMQVSDSKGGDLIESTEGSMGRMFANAVSYAVELRTWRDASGKLWAPGEFITLNWPEAMIYSDFTFLIRNVTFRKTSSTEIATLTLVIPGGFSGKVPEALPWE